VDHVSIYKQKPIWYSMSMYIIQDDIDWSLPGVKAKKMEDGTQGSPIALVVGDEVALTMAVDKEFADILISADSFEEDPESDESIFKYIVKINHGENVTQFRCTEMVYAILLSNPNVLLISDIYKHYRYVAPGWKFINNEFILPGEFE
jgi:hypothetical protein